MRGQEEFRLHCFVADTLRRCAEPEVLWTHFPSGEDRSAATGARLQRMGLHRGWPDLLFILPGPQMAFLELKSAKGRPTKEQEQFRSRVTALGCWYEVARTGDEAIGVLRGWGVITRARIAA